MAEPPSGALTDLTAVTGENCKVVQAYTRDGGGKTGTANYPNVATNQECTLKTDESGLTTAGFRSVISVKATEEKTSSLGMAYSRAYLRVGGKKTTSSVWISSEDAKYQFNLYGSPGSASALISLGMATAIATSLLTF